MFLVYQAQDFRVYVKEVVELGGGVSFLLLLPPCEEVCSPPGQNHLCSPRSGFLTLPLQIFELGETTRPHTRIFCPVPCRALTLCLCSSFRGVLPQFHRPVLPRVGPAGSGVPDVPADFARGVLWVRALRCQAETSAGGGVFAGISVLCAI